LAPGVTGKIHVGVAPEGSATVTVPACGVPLAAGTVPNPPVMDGVVVVFELLLQAARAAAPMTAQAAPFITGWATFIRSPCFQGGHGGLAGCATAAIERGSASQTGPATFLWSAGLSCSARSRPAALREA